MPDYRLRNPSQMPPGGWQFEQREIGWRAPHPLSETPLVLAARVRQLRLNNPVLIRLRLPTDIQLILLEIIAFNCGRNPQCCVQTGPQALEVGRKVAAKARTSCCGS